MAQILRDNKVFSIYEGTNGIQAMDLLGRKVPAEGGASVRYLMKEISKAISEAGAMESLKPLADKMQEVQNEVIAATMCLGQVGMSGEIENIFPMPAHLKCFLNCAVGNCCGRQVQQAPDTKNGFLHRLIETARSISPWRLGDCLGKIP